MFEMYEDEFIDADELEPGDQIQFSRENHLEERKGGGPGVNDDDDEYEDVDDLENEIEEEPNIVTIKTLTPSSQQLASLNLEPGENIVTYSVLSRL